MKVGFLQLARLGDWIQSMPAWEALIDRFSGDECYPICDERLVEVVRRLTGVEPIPVPVPVTIANSVSSEYHSRLSAFVKHNSGLDFILRLNDNALARKLQTVLSDSGTIDTYSARRTRRSESLIRIYPLLERSLHLHTSSHWSLRIHDKPILLQGNSGSDVRQIYVAVGSGGAERAWSSDTLVATVQLLSGYAPVHLIGSQYERDFANRIASMIGNEYRVQNLVGHTSIEDLMVMFKQTGTLVVGMDTGSLQMAAYCGAMTLSRFVNEANPHTTIPLSKISVGCTKNNNENSWLSTCRRFMESVIDFQPLQPEECRLGFDEAGYPVTRTGLIESEETKRIRQWQTAFILCKEPAQCLADREPFISLERWLLHHEERWLEPDWEPRQMDPVTPAEHFLSMLHWSLFMAEKPLSTSNENNLRDYYAPGKLAA